jgi:hypothetical protein
VADARDARRALPSRVYAGFLPVMIYRLISFWLVLLVGWIFFAVIRFRRPRRAAVRVEAGSTPEPGLPDSE